MAFTMLIIKSNAVFATWRLHRHAGRQTVLLCENPKKRTEIVTRFQSAISTGQKLNSFKEQFDVSRLYRLFPLPSIPTLRPEWRRRGGERGGAGDNEGARDAVGYAEMMKEHGMQLDMQMI